MKNPSFEAFETCPDRLGNFNADVTDWSSPTQASTDYFNACSTSMGTPENFNGMQPAEFGSGYAGLYLYAPDDYREYVQGELMETLQKGVTYEISFYVSLAERSDFAVRTFGLVFSREKLSYPVKKELSKGQLYKDRTNTYRFLEITHSEFYKETTDWINLHAEYTATGSERFLTIGNFEDNARTRIHKTSRNAKQGAYYYLDMVRVSPISGSFPAISDNISAPEAYSLDTHHQFEHVLFDFDTFVLTPGARLELQKLYEYLELHADLHITINGHTDNLGSTAYNMKLGGSRCQSVSDYLIALGLDAERVRWISHGASQPVAENTSEAGRKRNRRVVFSLSRAQREP